MEELDLQNPLETHTPDSFAELAIRLLQNVVYEEDTRLWQALTKVHELPLRRYFSQIGIQLVVDRTEGFAFLRQLQNEDDGTAALPRLMRRRPLTFEQSILCVLLRERLDEHSVRDTASLEPVLTLRDMREMVELFFRERNTQQRYLRDVKKIVSDITRFGFLEPLDSDKPDNDDDRRYRVRRILKAFIDTDNLNHLLNTIAAHLQT